MKHFCLRKHSDLTGLVSVIMMGGLTIGYNVITFDYIVVGGVGYNI